MLMVFFFGAAQKPSPHIVQYFMLFIYYELCKIVNIQEDVLR